jgi:hypothetical protein
MQIKLLPTFAFQHNESKYTLRFVLNIKTFKFSKMQGGIIIERAERKLQIEG